jgi:bacitracin transport system permease protein
MFINLFYIELLKYRKSILPWMIVLGGFFPAVVAATMVLNTNPSAEWDTLIITSLNYMNLLAMLLLAVITGYIYTEEYQAKTISILFTYPVSRFRLYLNKFTVLLFITFLIYLILYLSTLGLGLMFLKNAPAAGLLREFIKPGILMVLIYISLIPLTSLISLLGKGTGASAAAGICYLIINFTFNTSNWNVFLPVCIPYTVVMKYFNNSFGLHDIRNMAVTCIITFVSAFIISALYYNKSDVQ